MRNLLFILLAFSFTLYTCDDGDVIDVELEFEDTFEVCGETDLVLFKTKDDPSESLSVIINNFTEDDFFALVDNDSLEITKSGTFNYRTYSNTKISTESLFCEDVPSSDIKITNDYISDCDISILTVLTEDDNDGISAELEGKDPNGDGDFSDAIDTDGDEIPDYLDIDDDGDNVLTRSEDIDGDGDFTNDDSDGDGTPDYLDPDDDGDGVLTRDEDVDGNQDPTNDKTNPDAEADYLNPIIKNTYLATEYRTHTYKQTYEVTMDVTNIALEDLISITSYDFGYLTGVSLSNTETIEAKFPD